MAKTYRELYAEKVKGAIPANEDEAFLFDLAQKENERELLAEAIAKQLVDQKGRGGAPRKTAGDAELALRLLNKHSGDIRMARQEFIKIVIQQDNIEKKRARARFKAALEA